MYDYYNIFGYYTMMSSGTKHAVGRILNSMITSLNMRDRLPHMMIIMMDKDLIKDIGIFDHRADDIIAENIDWLFKQFEILLKHRCLELSEIKPGAVYGYGPKIVLVEMMRRPNMVFPPVSKMQAVLEMRRRFNAILNDAAAHFGYHCIYLESCSSEYQFDRMGKLNEQGMLDMWCEIDKLLEKFDCKKIDLKPTSYDKEKTCVSEKEAGKI